MKTRLLIVEDKTELRSMLRRLLQHRGYEVIEAGNGPEAVAMATTHLPQAILMDISLPEFDGFEATRQIRSVPGVGSVPIIFLTAHATAGAENQIQMRGGTDWITKPFDIDELVSKLEQYLPTPP